MPLINSGVRGKEIFMHEEGKNERYGEEEGSEGRNLDKAFQSNCHFIVTVVRIYLESSI